MAFDQKHIALIKSNLSIQIDRLYPLNADGTFKQDLESKDKAIKEINAWLRSYCINHNILPPVSFETLVTTYPAAFPTRGEKDQYGHAYRGVSRFEVLTTYVTSKPAASAHVLSRQPLPQTPSAHPAPIPSHSVPGSSQQPSTNPATMSVLSPEDKETAELLGWSLFSADEKLKRIRDFYEGVIEKCWPVSKAANTYMEEISAIQAINNINAALEERSDFPRGYNFRDLCRDFDLCKNVTPSKPMIGIGRFGRLKNFIASQPIQIAVSDETLLRALQKQPGHKELTPEEYKLLNRVFGVLQEYPRTYLGAAIEVVARQLNVENKKTFEDVGFIDPSSRQHIYAILKKIGIDALTDGESLGKTAAQLLESHQTVASARPPLASPAFSPSTSASSSTPDRLPESKPRPSLTSLLEAKIVALENGDQKEVVTLNRAIAIEKAIIELRQAGAKETRPIGEPTSSDDHALSVMLHMRDNAESSLADAIKTTITNSVFHVSEAGIRKSLEHNLFYCDTRDQRGAVYKALCAQDVARAQIANVAPAASVLITPGPEAGPSTSSRPNLVPSSSHTPSATPVIDKTRFTFEGGPSMVGSGFDDKSAAGSKLTWDKVMKAKYRDFEGQHQGTAGPAPFAGLNKK